MNNVLINNNQFIQDMNDNKVDESNIKESSNVIVSNKEFFIQEANKNYEKALKILDYDPETNTITGNSVLPNVTSKTRVLLFIDSTVSKTEGDCMCTARTYADSLNKKFNEISEKINEYLTSSKYKNRKDRDKKIKDYQLERKQLEEEINKFLKTNASANNPCLHLTRKSLNSRNLRGLYSVYHELGHVYYKINSMSSDKDFNEAEKYTDKAKSKISKNSIIYHHATDSEELLADNFAARNLRTTHPIEKDMKNYVNTEKQKMYGKIKTRRKELEKIKREIKNKSYNDFTQTDKVVWFDCIKNIQKSIKKFSETIDSLNDDISKEISKMGQQEAYDDSFKEKLKENVKKSNRQIKDYKSKINTYNNHIEKCLSEVNVKSVETLKKEIHSDLEKNVDAYEKIIDNISELVNDASIEANNRIDFIKHVNAKKVIKEMFNFGIIIESEYDNLLERIYN